MKYITLHIILLFSLEGFCQASITSDDLKSILGSWEGTITYLDYQTNTPFSMPANLIVEEGKNESTLILKNIFPDEPKANYSEKIKISKNGTLLNKQTITQRIEDEDGLVQIQTEFQGKDDHKEAIIRYTYILSENIFLIRKEVQFQPDEDWIKRSEFSYSRSD